MCVVKHEICPICFHMYICRQSAKVWSDIGPDSSNVSVMPCNKSFMSYEGMCVCEESGCGLTCVALDICACV